MLSKTWSLGIPAQDFVIQCQGFLHVTGARVRGLPALVLLLCVPANPSGCGHSAGSEEEVLSYRTDCYRPAFKATVSLSFLPKCLISLKEVEREEDSSDDDDDDIESLPQDPETCLQMNYVYQEVIKEKIEEVELLIAQNKEQQVSKAGVKCSFLCFSGLPFAIFPSPQAQD